MDFLKTLKILNLETNYPEKLIIILLCNKQRANILNAKLKKCQILIRPKYTWFLVRCLHEALYSEIAVLYLKTKITKSNISQEHLHWSILSKNAQINFGLKIKTE